MNIELFRVNFPEFSSVEKYPDSQIEFWAELGEETLIEKTWGKLYAKGLNLFVAHCITIAAQNARAGEVGLAPGGGGATINKSVGDTSVAYDTSKSLEDNAGWFNRTVYGLAFFRYANMIGAGARSV